MWGVGEDSVKETKTSAVFVKGRARDNEINTLSDTKSKGDFERDGHCA